MGKVVVVGIGPGDYENMTIRADRALRECQDIVGYHVYTELVKDRYPDKIYHTTGMTREAERCRLALDLARQGNDVAVVCSGDSGIYGMAALVYELRGEDSEPPIEVTAAVSGGAVLGAPLTHDFAVISLSDRLTDWQLILQRLTAAASSDLSIVLYNPASKGRPEHLKKAVETLRKSLPEDRICGIVRNIGREGEHAQILSLKELGQADVDMFCTVFIGNSQTKVIEGKLVTPRGYRYD